jgi:hypothetical protein
MPKRTPDVATYMSELRHPLKEGIAALCEAILRSSGSITQTIKWNAPSFRHDGEDRVTFRLPPKGGLQLVFHRGAKVKDATGFAFADGSGLIAWAAPDRGVVTLTDLADIRAKTPALVALVHSWMRATAEKAPS